MYNNEILLKEKLSEIKKNDYTVPVDINAYDFTLIMMKNIGSTDPELRDLLIHRVISRWIMNKVFTKEQLTELLNLNMDKDHLFYKLGEIEDDSVFTRTFCMLNLATIIYVHRNDNFLSDAQVKAVKENLIEYYSKEKDLRGHVDKKGWADSASHGADALDEIVQCDCMMHDDLVDVLKSIKNKIFVNYYTYVDFEDERITTAVVSAISRNILTEVELIAWVKTFENIPKTNDYPVDFRIIMNTRNFLRSLYFRLLDENKLPELIKVIKEVLAAIKQY